MKLFFADVIENQLVVVTLLLLMVIIEFTYTLIDTFRESSSIGGKTAKFASTGVNS